MIQSLNFAGGRQSLFLPAEHNVLLLYFPSEFIKTAERNLQDLKHINITVRPADPSRLYLLLADWSLSWIFWTSLRTQNWKVCPLPFASQCLYMPLAIASLSKPHLGSSRPSNMHPSPGPSGGWDPLISPQSSYAFCSFREPILKSIC